MKKIFNSFTVGGKIILVINFIAIIFAFILHRYDGLPFIPISVICVFLSFRKKTY